MGGVASWISTVAARLSARGFPVSIWGPGDRIPRRGGFDIGIIANCRHTTVIAAYCENTLNVTHGVIDDEEPDARFRIVATSEEVRDFWSSNATVIRQPVDLDFWRPGGERKKILTLYSYRAQDDFGAAKAARLLGFEFRWVRGVDYAEARAALQESAVVCASGRAALEAMACDAPTLICDWRDYNGGPLLCGDLDDAMRRNYSGRGGGKPDAPSIAFGALLAMETQKPREHVERHHDADKVAEELMALCGD